MIVADDCLNDPAVLAFLFLLLVWSCLNASSRRGQYQHKGDLGATIDTNLSDPVDKQAR